MIGDLKLAIRHLRRAPVFTAVTLLTLALCIGANSAIYSLVRAILLRPYPWPDSSRLVYVFNSYPLMGLPYAGVSVPDYLDRRDGVKGFADSAMYHGQSFALGVDGRPERLAGLAATPSLFSTLESQAAVGRVFSEADAKPGAMPTVVLSHDLWKSRFGSDPSLVGRTIRLNAVPTLVIGVMPEGFYFPSPKTEVWVPFSFTAEERTDAERGHEYSEMIARLAPGATAAGVQKDLDRIQAANAERLVAERPFLKATGFGGHTQGFLERNVANVRAMLWLLQAAVAAALLIGCANIAGLMLARAVAREHEFAVRSALGAGRGRLLRMLLAESLVLFVTGGALGLVFASWEIKAAMVLGAAQLPRGFGVRLDAGVAIFTMLCAIAAGVLFGLLPAWAASKANASGALKDAGSRSTAGKRSQRLRGGLVAMEVALAVMLLATAGLLIRSFEAMERQDPGFSPTGVLTAQVALPSVKYDSSAKIKAFTDALQDRLAATPGVRSVGIADIVPFSGMNSTSTYTSPDIVLAADAPQPHAQIRFADPGYVGAVGLRLLRGRWFAPSDVAGAAQVVVIDRILADRYWPGADPIGKRIQVNGVPGGPALVVGVVGTVKMEGLDQTIEKETIYLPWARMPQPAFMVVIRTSLDPTALAGPLRGAVRAIDAQQPVFDVRQMSDRMNDAAQMRRSPMIVLSTFSVAALLLAALGVYGILSVAVSQRTMEFGIRTALGASAGDIARLVLGQAMKLIAAGIAVGLAGYFAASAALTKVLYQVGTGDPVTLIAVLVLLAGVGLAAALIPAWRASRVDPASALRAE